MCLNNVTKTHRPNDMMRVGYKIYEQSSRPFWDRDDYSLHNPYYEEYKKHFVGKAYSVPKILENHKIFTYYDGDRVLSLSKYDAGFHIYSDKNSALEALKGFGTGYNMKLCKVMAWDIRAHGYQNKKKCFVARHYRIMERLNHKD